MAGQPESSALVDGQKVLLLVGPVRANAKQPNIGSKLADRGRPHL